MKLKAKRHILLIFFFLCYLVQLRSQCPPPPDKKVPFMWIPKDKSVERTLWFKFGKLHTAVYSKQEILNRLLGKEHPSNYTYSVIDFDKMLSKIELENGGPQNIKGLRVYFAAHKASIEPDNVPMETSIIPDKQIVLIFAPTDINAKDLNKYYIFGSDKKPYTFKKQGTIDLLQQWLNYYKDNAGHIGLVFTLEPSATENIDNGIVTDTESILYCYSDFLDFIRCERDYQNNLRKNSNKPPIDFIEIDFASFSDTGVSSPKYPSGFKNRLHLLFEFKSQNAIVYIDESKDFYNRLETLGIAGTNCDFPSFNIDKEINKGGDNGQLCPPYNCPK
ncbi:MAG: hypothetical protein JSS98_18430 [Bacteroidetes bacterium]|nr:hypothetical protein [Bacteroidota bacterium]MBS1738564.1 hypothetical protein [Bacteroidota bacterium]